jgi:hypothetical protein
MNGRLRRNYRSFMAQPLSMGTPGYRTADAPSVFFARMTAPLGGFDPADMGRSVLRPYTCLREIDR